MKNNIIVQNKLRWFYLIGFFIILALPLLDVPPWFSPPDWGKTIFFRIFASIIFFLFACQLIFQKDQAQILKIKEIWKNKKDKKFLGLWFLIALLAVYLLAMIFSLDARFSLWGSPYRAGGFVNFAFYIILAILAFLVFDQKDWQKIWNFAIFIGILVSIIAIFQQFGIFSQIILPSATQLTGTIGGPGLLGIYLLLLSFMALSFALNEKNIIKKIIFVFSFAFFVLIIVFTISQSSYFGLAVGGLWFLFFYPTKSKKIIAFRVIVGFLIILTLLGIFFLRSHPDILKNWKYAYISGAFLDWSLDESRLSAWKVSFEALMARPILGYGPENFEIGFNKFYDSSLPGIQNVLYAGGGWWDRAHNFIFDTSLTAGVPALIIYFSLFGIIFWQLQKMKKSQDTEVGESPLQSEENKNKIISHGIQAAFIAYFVANFFYFDSFSSYLISFLLISYSLCLIGEADKNETVLPAKIKSKYPRYFFKYKKITAAGLFVCLLWFIFQYNLKPFSQNTKINIAGALVDQNRCEEAISLAEQAIKNKSVISSYLNLKYIDYLRACEPKNPKMSDEYTKKGVEIMEENIKIQPNYVRNWIFLGNLMTVLITKEQDPANRQKMIAETEQYFEKAGSLSPKRQEVFVEWAKFAFYSDNYQLLKEKSEQCIKVNPELNPELADCYWFKGLSDIISKNFDGAKKNLDMADKIRRYGANPTTSLLQLAKAYGVVEDYPELADIYQKLIAQDSENPQYHATLAAIYKELKDYKNAKIEAKKFIELLPSGKQEGENFIKGLPR